MVADPKQKKRSAQVEARGFYLCYTVVRLKQNAELDERSENPCDLKVGIFFLKKNL